MPTIIQSYLLHHFVDKIYMNPKNTHSHLKQLIQVQPNPNLTHPIQLVIYYEVPNLNPTRGTKP